MIKETAQFVHEHGDNIKNGFDSLAIAGVAAAVMKLVPPITAIVSLIYILVRLYETETVQSIVKRKKKDVGQGSTEEKSD